MIEDGVDGLLVPPGDVDALAEAMRRLAGDPALRSTLGERARNVADQFSPLNVGRQVERVYRRVAEPRPF